MGGVTVSVEVVELGTRWRATRNGDESDAPARAEAWIGRLHTSHGWLDADESLAAATLRELATALADAAGVPPAAKAVPGSARHAWLTEAGATAYMVCPPSQIDCTDPLVRAWASRATPPGIEVTDATEYVDAQLLELWVGFYVWTHEPWSPVSDPEVAREVFAPMIAEELDRARSVLVLRDGMPSALGFVFPEDEGWPVCCEAVAADAPHGAEDVDTCLGAVVAGLGDRGVRDLLVDGHVVDPHLFPALQGVHKVTGAGLHLMQVAATRDARWG